MGGNRAEGPPAALGSVAHVRVWLNGDIVDGDDATISVFDHGLTVGDGVFETLKIYPGGRPFAVRRHLERLEASATGLGLSGLPPPTDLRDAMDRVISENHLDTGRLRITVTGGPAPLGSGRGHGPLTVIIAAGALDPTPPFTDVVVVPWPRNERSAVVGLKTTSSAENVVALAYARERGATEAVFLNLAGHVCEGTGSNVFVVRDGRLVTPPLDAGCLAGVTRALLLEITDAQEASIAAEGFAAAEEAFLTSTTREVQPITGKGGPVTAAAAAAFAELVARDIDP